MCERKTAVPVAVAAAGAGTLAIVVVIPALAAIAVAAAVADLLLVAWLVVVLLRGGGRMWRPPAVVKAPARVAVQARSAQLAIEAPKPEVCRITDVQESSVERVRER